MKKKVRFQAAAVVLLALALAMAGCGDGGGNTEAPSLVSIAITGAPATYAAGAALNVGGLTVTLTYSDGSTTPVTLPAETVVALDAKGTLTYIAGGVTITLSGYNPNGTDAQTITVTVGSKTQQFTINLTSETTNKATLTTAITTANSAKSGVVVDTAAANVAVGTKWVTQAVLDTFNTAITTAEGVATDNEATADQITGAVTVLNTAVTTFNAAKQDGTKTGGVTIDKTALTAAITTANTAKSGVAVDTAATNVAVGTKWVTKGALDTFNAAITAADGVSTNNGATQVQVDGAVTALNSAVTTFNAAKQDGTKTNEVSIDKAALIAAIATANTAKVGVVVDTAAANVATGTKWVTQAVMTTFENAISAAGTVSTNNSATQAQVNSAVTALNTAITTFNGAKQDGAKTGEVTIDKTALTAAITTANSAKSGVVVDTAAGNVATGTKWVTKGALDTFNAAITAAEGVAANNGATQAQINSAVTTLNSAVTTFNAAKQDGTKTNEVPIDKTILTAAITTANATKTGVVVDTAATNVAVGTKWVTKGALDTFNAAITAAEGVAANNGATQAQVNSAVTTLNAAIATFNDAKRDGTKTNEVPIDKTILTAAITTANTAKVGVAVDTAAANVAAGTEWVTKAASDTFNAAITTAEGVAANNGATQAQVDDAVTALNTAVTTFKAAKRDGTKTNEVPIDKTILTAAITTANTAKVGVAVDTAAANVAAGTEWVTKAASDTFNAAITTAEGVAANNSATQAQVDDAVTALNSAVTTFKAAKKDGAKTDAPAFVAVTGITLTSAATTIAGTPLTLAATVAPTNATNQTIVWSVNAAGTTGASITNGELSATRAGTAKVTATITNGATATTAYVKDFDITVTVPPLAFAGSASYDIPAGTVSEAISPVTIGAATGGTTPYSYTVSEKPAWISFDAATLVISGKRPAAAAAAGSFTITVTDSATPAATKSITVAYDAVSAPVPGSLKITVSVDKGEVAIERSDKAETPIVLSKGGTTKTLTLSATGFTDIKWLLNGNTAAPIGTTDSITIDASGYAVKKHSVTFTGWKGTTFYSSDPIDFSVKN